MPDLLWAGRLRQLPFSVISGSGIPGVALIIVSATLRATDYPTARRDMGSRGVYSF
jgi:hypothetical protein